MLFDLRSRGRRRSVKVVYTGLSILLFVGLVFLGVGGITGGSFLENLGKEGGGGRTYAAKITAAKKRIAKNPQDAAAWVALTEAELHEASGGEFYNSATGGYTSKGKAQLRRAVSSWNSYLALNPNSPSVRLAKEMSNVFGTEALNEPANAVAALQIVIAAEPPSAKLYSLLAQYSYLAKNIRQGDLASQKAVSLVPKANQAVLQSEFERMKRSATKPSSGAKAGATGSASTATSTTATSSPSSAGKKK